MKAETVKIFVYGLLQPGFQPPLSTTDPVADSIQGDLYDLGDYPAAFNIGKSTQLIPGFVITIDSAELPTIDAFEDIESGEYRRIHATTEAGIRVLVYEYARALPLGAKKIAAWR